MTHTWEHAIPNSYMATTPFEFLVLPPCASDSNPESNAVNAGNVGNEVTTSGDVQLPPGVPSFGTSAGIEDGANDLDNRNGQEYERSLTAIDVNCERSPNELERVDHQTGELEEMESLLRATMDAANNIHHAAATEAVAASSGRAQFVPCTPPAKSNTRPKTRFNTAAVAKNSDDAAPTPPVPKTPTAKCLNKRPVIKVQGSVVSRGPAAVVVDRSRRLVF